MCPKSTPNHHPSSSLQVLGRPEDGQEPEPVKVQKCSLQHDATFQRHQETSKECRLRKEASIHIARGFETSWHLATASAAKGSRARRMKHPEVTVRRTLVRNRCRKDVTQASCDCRSFLHASQSTFSMMSQKHIFLLPSQALEICGP